MKNRLKWYFDQTSSGDEFSNPDEFGDLAKIVANVNQSLSPHVSAKIVGDEAVVQCKNKTVWIDKNCLVTGESFTPLVSR
ncbi:MAG TPA: hypothetical protein VGY56_04760 [Verrucomicrobiae bacterium]|nr:hypothetical protein [Verrucomicrobiae bacterium]